MSPATQVSGVQVLPPLTATDVEILTPEALWFLQALAREFEPRREALLLRRAQRQADLNTGSLPVFLPETRTIRESDWRISPIPADLTDRRVEITGPVERKMVINALNSGANVFMADFEDATAPTWKNIIQGQVNLRDAVRGTISHTGPDGKQYRLNSKVATLMVRPRGWHLTENHVLVDGRPISASLFDFGLYLYRNAKALAEKGSGPYFYLPKLESHLEAQLWNDVFIFAQERLGIPQGTIKATVLIETILAAFEMDEILYELKEHSAGLNCGRWDYIFSCIKKFRHNPGFVLADRGLITMTTPFMRAYALLAIQTCHRRNTHAIGGMAAQIPIKGDPIANEAALAKVREDKEREASDGHDGTWVAHPGLVPVARTAFDTLMPTPNQIHRKRPDVQISAKELLDFGPKGPITETGLRTNISVSLQYLGAWLSGQGCAPINNLMEDAATAEISRSQLWQWIHNPNAKLADGGKITLELVRQWIPEEMASIERGLKPAQEQFIAYASAAQLLDWLVGSEEFVEFLTLPAYDLLLASKTSLMTDPAMQPA